MLIYHGVDVSDPRALFAAHGWGGAWTGHVFQFHHFHSRTGHCRTESGGGFTVVGAYPRGQEDYDLLREADDAARERIANLPAPPQDPVGGDGVARWSR